MSLHFNVLFGHLRLSIYLTAIEARKVMIADITSTCLASLSLYSSDFRFCILVQSSVGVLCPARSHHVMLILAVHNPQKLEFTKASPVLQEKGSERCRSYRTALPLLVPRLWERGAEGHKDCASSFWLFHRLHFVQESSPWLCFVWQTQGSCSLR